jgi:subtilisin family serine protease
VVVAAAVAVVVGCGSARADDHAGTAWGSLEGTLGSAAAESVLFRSCLDSDQAKIDSTLRQVLSAYRNGTVVGTDASDLASAAPRVDARRRVQVYIELVSGVDAPSFVSGLLGFDVEPEIVSARFGMIQAWVRIDDLQALARLPEVRALRTPGYPVTAEGGVDSEGDSLVRADQTRDLYAVEGQGVVIGVLSDGLAGMADAQSSGDLPQSPSRIHVVKDGNGAEGTAMMEIIHDLAPDASYAFYAPSTSLDMTVGISALAQAEGAEVLVDDLIFLDEPVFEDGPVAQAVAGVVADGVSYHTSAGNQAIGHYEGVFDGRTTYVLGENIKAHDFGGGDTDLDVAILAGKQASIVLQWNDPFGASSNDYDLLVFDATRTQLIAASGNVQNGSGDPREVVSINNSGTQPATAKVVVRRYAGRPKRIEIHVFRSGIVLDHNMPEAGLFGHAAVDGAIAVGAVSADDPELDQLASYSAQGPSRLDFPWFELRAKPDLVAIDGVQVSGAGGFPSPFFGTSAAAPHSAAVAALLLSGGVANGHDVYACLTGTAIDLGAPGFDSEFGYGRLDALEAAQACLTLPKLCGDFNGDRGRTASDALGILAAAVGGAVPCPGCVCDVNGSGGITASDALVVLQYSVGQGVALACPAC